MFIWSKPYFYLWKKNFRTNLIVFCRSTFIYIFGKFGVKAKVEIKVQKVISIGVKVLFLFIRAFKINLSLLIKKKLL